jgi:hypothetical protein
MRATMLVAFFFLLDEIDFWIDELGKYIPDDKKTRFQNELVGYPGNLALKSRISSKVREHCSGLECH